LIKGLGVDIIEIDRIEKAIQNNEGFLYRLFTEKEIEFFKACNYRTNTIAGSFAAKEAVVKALGTGVRGFSWKDIEIVRDKLGKPDVLLHGSAKDIAIEKNIKNFLLSISHCKAYAIAEAIAQ